MKKIGLYPVQDAYFDPKAANSLPRHHLDVWPGFMANIQPVDGGRFLLNVDTMSKVIRTGTVLDMLREMSRDRNFHEIAQDTLVESVVMTRFNSMTYRVKEIAWDSHPDHQFELRKTGESISFVDYYQKHHNQRISDLRQPMLVVQGRKKTDKIMIPPELCFPTVCSQFGE